MSLINRKLKKKYSKKMLLIIKKLYKNNIKFNNLRFTIRAFNAFFILLIFLISHLICIKVFHYPLMNNCNLLQKRNYCFYYKKLQ